MSAGIYPAWHPDGNHIAFSTGRISPHLTTRLYKPVDVADRASDLMIYDIRNNTVTTSPAVSTAMRENMPVWSPDGRYLYYICAPGAVKGDEESLLHSRYSLMRIVYSTKLDTWGEPEMVLSADSTGMSISMPAISPDGRYLACSMSDYGYFTIFHRGSDLYCVDLETNDYWKLGLNSSSAESHPSWSSNGRWLVFSSKRIDGVLSRPFIAYIDENGQARTPFVLPQKDPEMYERLVANYNLPRLITGRINLRPVEIRDAVLKEPRKVKYE
jgi:Tol biopolymer transport system component